MGTHREALIIHILTIWILVVYPMVILRIHGVKVSQFSAVTMSESWALPSTEVEKPIPKGKLAYCSLHCQNNVSCNVHNVITADETTCKMKALDLGLMYISFASSSGSDPLDVTYYTNAITELPEVNTEGVLDEPVMFLFHPSNNPATAKSYVYSMKTAALSETQMLYVDGQPAYAKYPICYNADEHGIFFNKVNGNDFTVYHPKLGSWTTLPTVPGPGDRYYAQVFQLDEDCSKIVFTGGSSTTTGSHIMQTGVYVYDVAAGTWSTSGVTLGGPLTYFGYSRIPGTLTFYAIGGSSCVTVGCTVNTMREINVETEQITMKAELADEFNWPTCGPVKNTASTWNIVCMETKDHDLPIRIFDVDQNSWTVRAVPGIRKVRNYAPIISSSHTKLYYLVYHQGSDDVNGFIYDSTTDSVNELEGLEPGTIENYEFYNPIGFNF